MTDDTGPHHPKAKFVWGKKRAPAFVFKCIANEYKANDSLNVLQTDLNMPGNEHAFDFKFFQMKTQCADKQFSNKIYCLKFI
jgi:hypothetical protein